MDGPNARLQGFVAAAPVGVFLEGLVRPLETQVLEVATGADLKRVAHHGNWPLLFVTRYLGLPHEDSLEKYEVVFLRCRAPFLKLATSARSMAIFICSALTGLMPAPLSLLLATRLTQLSSVSLGMPSTPAIHLDDFIGLLV